MTKEQFNEIYNSIMEDYDMGMINSIYALMQVVNALNESETNLYEEEFQKADVLCYKALKEIHKVMNEKD